MLPAGAKSHVVSHAWERETLEHYVEPSWCSERLFQAERFDGSIQDPSCGFGRIVQAGTAAGLPIFGTDLVDRGFRELCRVADFFTQTTRVENIVSNPPFGTRKKPLFKRYALHAINLATRKVALIWLTRTLPAAGWLKETPLKTIYFLTPRPSMPPGDVIVRGEKPVGGKQDFCWLVWERGFVGTAEIRWLRRDGEAS
jgi:hypothetical protein